MIRRGIREEEQVPVCAVRTDLKDAVIWGDKVEQPKSRRAGGEKLCFSWGKTKATHWWICSLPTSVPGAVTMGQHRVCLPTTLSFPLSSVSGEHHSDSRSLDGAVNQDACHAGYKRKAFQVGSLFSSCWGCRGGSPSLAIRMHS